MRFSSVFFCRWTLLGLVTFVACQPTPRSLQGGPCLFDSDCEKNLRCAAKTCVGNNGEGSPCSAPQDCPSGLKCLSGRCLSASGGQCASDSECTNGFRCVLGNCINPVPKGSACTDSAMCIQPFVCNAKGFCEDKGSPGSKGSGETCDQNDDCQFTFACRPSDKTCVPQGSEGIVCAAQAGCKTPLVCAFSGLCAAAGSKGTTAGGLPCETPSDCLQGLTCSSRLVCLDQGSAKAGDGCRGNETCAPGLLCATTPDGQICAPQGTPGTKQKGETCTTLLDCAPGLLCAQDQTCKIFPLFQGVACQPLNEITGDFRVFFEVPRASKPVTEFYRLPFPNDIRKKDDGTLDLSGHVVPRPDEPNDFFPRLLRTAGAEMDGFGLNQAVYLRLTRALNFDTLDVGGSKPHVLFYDIDKNANLGLSLFYGPQRGRYICDFHLIVRPFSRLPLAPKRTYAALVMRGPKAADGSELKRDADFDAMMKETPPAGDPELLRAHARYQKLRDFLARNLKDGKYPGPEDVVGAAVFTTHDPHGALPALRTKALSVLSPKLKSLTLCDGKTTSPCVFGDAKTRSCGEVDPEIHEIHAQIAMPVFQRGDRPYKTSGGDLAFEGDGTPRVIGFEDVCVALAIPKAPAPVGGWPTLVYAHGTGGNFKSHVAEGIAKRIASIQIGGAAPPQRFASIGFDQHLHGPRRGASTDDPGTLFFNLDNLTAARNNPVQAAADIFTLVAALKQLSLPAAESPTKEALRVDPARLAFLGHSQGGVTAPLWLAYEPDVPLVLLSGAGVSLSLSLLNKTSPINVAGGMRFLLADPSLGRDHPAINLIQAYFDRADGLNSAPAVFQNPDPAASPKSLFLIYGLGDTFTPNATTDFLALALGLPHVKPVLAEVKGLPATPLDPPVRGNLTKNGKSSTVGFVQYKPAQGDGHFVLFSHPDAQRQTAGFLASWLTDPESIPSILP